jgi:hypothetical protein
MGILLVAHMRFDSHKKSDFPMSDKRSELDQQYATRNNQPKVIWLWFCSTDLLDH